MCVCVRANQKSSRVLSISSWSWKSQAVLSTGLALLFKGNHVYILFAKVKAEPKFLQH